MIKMTTLSLEGNFKKIQKVIVDNQGYMDYTGIPVKPGSHVTMHHDSSREWHYNTSDGTGHRIGQKETIEFTVPADAEGIAKLFVDGCSYHDFDYLHFNKSSGWIRNVNLAQ